ncbi:DUF4269 domain-containing protein [Bacillus clarus]|uniref:DUF4269 domain-containing protein n=1 Tax=Bacillus clarus TaxID=2338372 RepID=A0A090Z1H0_9BACI|nr:DUF4269 domain-containing protein [Bacillus clarus]KFN04213.1 hypothetical protein DJ93_5076 [Bacillus clarus]RFT62432.1 DUF4269 domain-containing protein [Bacillus clarus]
MFTSITYLRSGNEKQQKVYDSIDKIKIMEDLALYTPVLCGTVPIRIDTVHSDLDIVMEVHNFDEFEKEIQSLYGCCDEFEIKRKNIRNIPTIKASFQFEGFKFELFAQPQPVRNQYAYKHMVVEHMLLMQQPHIRKDIISLKAEGIKTEPAFAQILNIDGDPYEELILLGHEMKLW